MALRAIDELIEREGGYVNHHNDPGKATKYGVTEAIARHYNYLGNMADLPRDTAAQILTEEFYIKPKIHLISSSAVRDEVLDSAVMSSPVTAIRWLQRALNQFGCNPPLKEDGILGYTTRSMLEQFLMFNRKRDGEKVLVKALNAYQGHYLMELGEWASDFKYGWIRNRVGF